MTWGTYVKNVLIWLDQGANTIVFGGSPDETVSARCYRQRSIPKWAWRMKFLDRVFFWQTNHCEESFKWEYGRKDMPLVYQDLADCLPSVD